MSKDVYENPLVGRYAADEMKRLFSPQKKFSTWRRLWLALAESENELGLAQISDEAIAQMRANLDNINYEVAEERERETRHDVMSHVHAFGLQAPAAAGIIHLGATSQFVNCNTDIILHREGLHLLKGKCVAVIRALAEFAKQHAAQPCLGSTHFQVAQLVTVGKRATLWINDLLGDYYTIAQFAANTPLRGVKGTTGTQASFLTLFDGDHDKVKQLDRMVCAKMGVDMPSFPVTGQTYSRKVDHMLMSAISGIGVSLHKMGEDIRLLMG
ncbi:MAG: adenylosuccinate lyase, partial [Planctomycetes bacterium]|nr:adenylosuccinate lyase [Planctomycetota bacterium]